LKRTQQNIGTITRKKRSRGPDIWVWRVYLKDDLEIIRKKSFILGTIQEWPTKAHAWKGSSERRQALLGGTFGKLIERYVRDALSDRYSTRSSYLSRLNRYILPKWKDVPMGEVKAYDVEQWLKSIARSPKNEISYQGYDASVLRICNEVGNDRLSAQSDGTRQNKGRDQANSEKADYHGRPVSLFTALAITTRSNDGRPGDVHRSESKRDPGSSLD